MNGTIRCAIYARFSSDLQRPTSIEDQVRRCREFAAHQGWSIVEEFVRFDEAKSAATLAGRDALAALMKSAKGRPTPFDCLLVDDTSRLARYLPDVLSMNDKLRYWGIFIYAVAQRLDCREKTSRPLLTLHGMMDEQFLVSLAEKVHRGQEGRALKGMQPGGKCFGYRNVPIEDPTRSGKYGRAAVSGVKLDLDEEQADVVRRVFDMYAIGHSLTTIAKKLNEEGVVAPQPPRTRLIRAWCPSSIREMLRNERYRGVFVWNRTRKERNPETGRKISRPRPESDWMRVEVPEWRIVSEELWEGVQRRINFVSKRFGSYMTVGGQTRTERSRRYLFSGFLACGVCGSNMVIVSGNGRRGYVKYGCPSHRYRGVCANSVMIRQDRLEDQLLAGLTERVLRPEMLEYTFQRFSEELQRRLRQIQEESVRAASGVNLLQERRRELKTKADNLAEAIAAMGHSPTLLSQLATVETQIARIDQDLAEINTPRDLEVTMADLRKFVAEKALDLQGVLRADVSSARQALAKHVEKLVLTPKETLEGPVLEVSGDVDLFGGDERVMQLVARDGIEPPTPAFQGCALPSGLLGFLCV
jgi:site-specific DNA recombinase